MEEMTIIIIRATGGAIADALSLVKMALADTPDSTNGAPPAATAPAAKALPAADQSKPRTTTPAPRKVSDGGPYVQTGSMQDKALACIRGSHYGVTSDEIYAHVNCATVRSAYQICLELEKKGLIERTDAGAWKALNA